MKGDMSSFLEAIDNWERKLGPRTEESLDALAEFLYKRVKETTPVGIFGETSDHPGFARDSWKLNKHSDERVIFNNAPYINMLEFGGYPPNGPHTTSDGYSTQAPKGMARLAYQEMMLNMGAIIKGTYV